MEEVPRQQHHIDIPFFGDGHDFVKGFPAVVPPLRVAFRIPNMVVRSDKHSHRIDCLNALARASSDVLGIHTMCRRHLVDGSDVS